MIPVLVICGGKATRLYPITKVIPKSLIEISNRPFISYQLELLKHKGVSDVILCVGKFGKQIEEYVGNGSKWGLNVKYSYDGDVLLGTGGAIKKAINIIEEDNDCLSHNSISGLSHNSEKKIDVFMVMYGDSYLNVDFKLIVKWFEKEGKQGLMTVYRNEDRWDKSNILFRDGQIVKYDKKNPTSEMKHIDYGIIVLRKDVFNGWDGVFDLSDVFIELIEKGEMAGVEIFERFYEIGSVEGVKEFETFLYS